MTTAISNSLRLPSTFVSTVTLQYQSVRTARRLTPQKYFHPYKPLTPLWIVAGEKAPTAPPIPPYPYGPNRAFPAADTGLYGGAQIGSGHKISKGRNKGKTLRKWYPHIRIETLRSEALEEDFSLKVSTGCIRTIRKCGGLDQYLLGDKPARIKELGLLGWSLRWRVMTSPKMRKEYQKEREQLGLPRGDPALRLFEDDWADPDTRSHLLRSQVEEWQKLREKNERFNRQWSPNLEKFRGKDYNIEEHRKQQMLLEQRPDEFEGLDELPSVRKAVKLQIRGDPAQAAKLSSGAPVKSTKSQKEFYAQAEHAGVHKWDDSPHVVRSRLHFD